MWEMGRNARWRCFVVALAMDHRALLCKSVDKNDEIFTQMDKCWYYISQLENRAVSGHRHDSAIFSRLFGRH